MLSRIFYRILQVAGWTAALAGPGIVAGTILAQAPAGPVDGQSFIPPSGLLRILCNSLLISLTATCVAFLVGVAGGAAAIFARRPWLRIAFRTLMLVTILMMPSVYGYAWQLLLTSDHDAIRAINRALATTGAWGARGLSAIALGMWLWPIPAFVLLEGFRRAGAAAAELAMLDARPWRAMWRGVLPVLRGPMIAAAAGVFVVSALESTIPPLMLASDVWAVEMMREAELARASARPAAYLFWRAWPMLAVVGVLAIAALPGLRRMVSWHRELSFASAAPRGGAGIWPIPAGILTMCAAMMPIVVFSGMLATDPRYSLFSAITDVWPSARGPAAATAIVALATAALSFAVASASDMGRRANDGGSQWWGRAFVTVTLVTAVLPPSLVGTTLISFYGSARFGDAAGWNVYDDTPLVWIAACLARFAFIPVCLTAMAGLVAPTDVADQTATDGASGLTAWRFGRWPFIRGAALIGSAIAGLLAWSEVQASSLTRAPRWGDDSLAVYLDGQMHYGRHGQTLALALLMYVPVFCVALIAVIATRGGVNANRQAPDGG